MRVWERHIIFLTVPCMVLLVGWKMGQRKYLAMSILILFWIVFYFFILYEKREPESRELITISVIVAIGIVGRAGLFMVRPFSPIDAVTIIGGVSFGPLIGFIIGALIMFTSNIIFGQGPWTPWQMVALGIVGFVSGLFRDREELINNRLKFSIFGFILTMVIYGGIMNPAAAIMWYETLTIPILKAYYISGIPYDFVHASGTAFFLWFGSKPMLEKISRVKVKYGLLELYDSRGDELL